MAVTASRPLTVAEARSLGHDIDEEAAYFGAPRVQMMLDRLHADALAEHIGGVPRTAAPAMAFHAAHQPHQH